MRLGLGPIELASTPAHELQALAEAAAASSFDCVWVAESRANGVGAGLAVAAMVAQRVPIRVGAVVDAGLYHPLHLAEDIAVADLSCAGRLEVLLRPAAVERDELEEHLTVLVAALSGAHIQWDGTHLRVPARLAANQPVPERLALNPRPMQPVVPVWLLAEDAWTAALAARLGLSVARRWSAEARIETGPGRLPQALLCPADVSAAQVLRAAGEAAGYFIVEASSPGAAWAAGRRLAGPLRMPGFPSWINSG